MINLMFLIPNIWQFLVLLFLMFESFLVGYLIVFVKYLVIKNNKILNGIYFWMDRKVDKNKGNILWRSVNVFFSKKTSPAGIEPAILRSVV